MVNVSGGMAAATLLLAAFMAPAAMGYMDFEHMSTPELEDILGALEEEAAAGDYRDVEPAEGDDYADYYREAEEGNPDYVYPLDEELQPEGDYFLPEDLSIQQRQQEDLSHGTPIAGGAPNFMSASNGVGGTTKANPPKNSGAVLPAYCDPPNPCPIGYTAKDGCVSLEDFENTSEFSREFQSRQNCLCDSEHMFNCPAEAENNAAAAGQNPAFLAGMPPSLESQLPAGVGAKLVAKKGVGL